MTGKGHLIFGMCAGATTAILTKMPVTSTSVAVGLASVAVAALAADLDEPNSILGQKLSLPPNVVKTALLVIGLMLIASAYFAGGIAGGLVMVAGAATFFVSQILKSKTSRGVVLAAIGILLVAFGFMYNWYWLICLGAFVGVAPWTPHRTVTHTIWAVALWGYIGYGFEQVTEVHNIGWVITVAYASHLIADSLTKARVKWLLGIYNKPIGIPLIRVGTGGMELAVNVVFVIATILLYVSQNSV